MCPLPTQTKSQVRQITLLSQHFTLCFDAVCPNQHLFRHVRMIFSLLGLNQYQAADKAFCLRTQHSDSTGSECQRSKISIPSLTLYQLSHWALHHFYSIELFACWVIFHAQLLCSSADFFQINFFQNTFRNTIRASKSLDPDQD